MEEVNKNRILKNIKNVLIVVACFAVIWYMSVSCEKENKKYDDNIRDEAYADGESQGYDKGYDAGHYDGYNAGYEKGQYDVRDQSIEILIDDNKESLARELWGNLAVDNYLGIKPSIDPNLFKN